MEHSKNKTMKTLLTILLVAISAYAYYLQRNEGVHQDTLTKLTKEHSAEIAAVKAEAKNAKEEVKLLEIELSKIKTPVPAPPAAASEQKNEQAAIERRLTELRSIYDKNHTTLSEQKAILTSNLSKAQSIRDSLKNPQFSEHRTRRNGDNSTSIVGIKMSQADKDQIMAKHQAQVDQITNQIAAIEGEMVAVESRFQALDAAYREAVEKARREEN